ncbi:MAG: hypothetical protein IRY99_02690 [Isosphaeraceae bacterium]|nr:hypothetical protein [Isosphaeraceae bacterium]
MMALLVLIGLAVPGAGPPEVIRLRVPSGREASFFPPNSELKGMPLDEFETLVRSAQAGWERLARRHGPRLIRAQHEARWEDGVLIGRSELRVQGASSGASLLDLMPWSPVIDRQKTASDAVRYREDGRLCLKVEPEEDATVTIAWELRARTGSEGRSFLLEVPACESTTLVLDLPAGLLPEGPPGLRQGPSPGPSSERRCWRFDGPGGRVPIQIHPLPAGSGQKAPLGVGGTTRIDIGEAAATWRADWIVEPGPGTMGRLLVELDPGLTPIEVSGPGLAAYSFEAQGSDRRIEVRLSRGSIGPTPITIRAQARVPEEGTWTVPAARVPGAFWTGGRTIIRLGSARVLESCRERAGRRIAPRAEDGERSARSGPLLVFETFAPEAVADLIFRKPWVDASAEVRGRLLLGREPPRFEARIDWRIDRGRLPILDVQLSPGWTPDRLQDSQGVEMTTWHSEPLPGGGMRIIAHPPMTAEPGAPPTLSLLATAAEAEPGRPLELPRVRPLGVRVAEELWVARVEPSWTVQPLKARGLAWIDPEALRPTSAEPVDLRSALAWRWISSEAQAQVLWSKVPAEPLGEVQIAVAVDPERLRLTWFLILDLGEGLERIVSILANDWSGPPPQWRVFGEEFGPPLTAQPLEARERAEAGFPQEGEAWRLELPHGHRGRLVLSARSEHPWTGRGKVPIVALPQRYRPRTTVLVATDPSLLSEAEANGLRVLDPASAWRSAPWAARATTEGDSASASRPRRRTLAFGATGPVLGRLGLRTERLQAVRPSGLISEALLTTIPGGASADLQQLSLHVLPGGEGQLEIQLPPGSILDRIRREGQTITPIQRGDTLSIPLPSTTNARATCSIDLSYRTPPAPGRWPTTLAPPRPTFSLPCLALTWNVVLPPGLGATPRHPFLVVADPAPGTSWSQQLLGDWSGVPWPWGESSDRASRRALLEKEVEGRVGPIPAEETTLGDWLLRWDVIRWPVLIDRLALASIGWGPNSRLRPIQAGREGPAAPLDMLRSLGLTVVPVADVLLVTTPAAAPSRSAEESLSAALRVAVATGSDPSDRYQTVPRWRGEGTPEPDRSAVGTRSAADASREAGVRPALHFEALGWPASGLVLDLSSRSGRVAWGWAVALGLLALAVAGRGLSVRWGALGIGLILGAAAIVAASAPSRGSPVAIGLIWGSLASLAFWWGASLRRLRSQAADEGRRAGSSLRYRATRSGAALALVVILWPQGPIGRAAIGEAPAEAPIVALIPYDEIAEATGPGRRVVLLLKDYERLRAWAEAQPDRPIEGLFALDAVHRVRPEKGGGVIVESQFDLLLEGVSSAAWTLPVGAARDLAADLDGRAAPLSVLPGGKTARVLVMGLGRHRLIFRRTVDLERNEDNESLSLPIHPVASARVLSEEKARPKGRGIECPTALGRVEAHGDTLEARLGRSDRLELRWIAENSHPESTPRGEARGVLLWEALPAGDRVRARFTFRDPKGTALARFALGKGWVVRSAIAPGLIDTASRSTQASTQWSARFEPPLTSNDLLELELWRPAVLPPKAGPSGRLIPQVEPLGFERVVEILGLLGPEDWEARLGTPPGAEGVTEEEFQRAWGQHADARGKWIGALQFSQVPGLEVPLGPAGSRPTVETALHLGINAGRVDVLAEATYTDHSGRSYEVKVSIPPELRIVRIEAPGSTDWSRPAPNRLRIRYDGPEATERSLRIQGWLPCSIKPLAVGPIHLRRPIPWLSWPDAEESSGVLTISAPPWVSPRIEAAEGLTPIAVDPDSAAEPSGWPARLAYRFASPEISGMLLWTAEPTRVSVAIRSLLTLYPDSAAWAAVAHYEISEGPCDTLQLKLPKTWAAQARVEVPGHRYTLTADSNGESSLWTLRFETPLWGAHDLYIQAEHPTNRSEALDFPDLVPLGRFPAGRGSVDTYLAIADASGRDYHAEGSAGLQPVDVGRFRLEGFHLPSGEASLRAAYHVLSEGWSLRLHSSGRPPVGDLGDVTHISLAELSCSLTPEGTLWGRARYALEGRSGPFLMVVFPERAEALAALVDGVAVRPWLGASGRYYIPLGEGTASSVELTWKAAPDPAGGRTTGVIPLPGLLQPRVPTLITLHAPESIQLSAESRQLKPTRIGHLEVERAGRMQRRIIESLDQFDRSSSKDRAALISALVRFELQGRAAERALRWEPTARSSEEGAAGELLERLRLLRSQLEEDLQAAGLDEFAQAARARLGLTRADPLAPSPTIPEPEDPLRIRPLGVCWAFLGDSPGDGHWLTLRWTARPTGPSWRQAEPWGLLLAAVTALLGLLVVSGPGVTRRRVVASSLMLAALVPLFVIVPMAGGLMLAMLGLGLYIGR